MRLNQTFRASKSLSVSHETLGLNAQPVVRLIHDKCADFIVVKHKPRERRGEFWFIFHLEVKVYFVGGFMGVKIPVTENVINISRANSFLVYSS